MKPSLAAGLTDERRVRIDRERTIDFMGDACRVYATPMLVRDVEVAARELLLRHLDPGEDSVGTRVELDHLAPTLAGMDVDIRLAIAAVDGRAVTFDVTASDGVEPVARGLHKRYVVDVAATGARLAAKARKAGLPA